VQWWDDEDEVSDFSEVVQFEMGLMSENDWRGTWITKLACREFKSKGSVLLGEPLGDYVNAFTLYLRREFALARPVIRARVCICGLGYYELRINGRKVSDHVLDPAQTDYKRIALYATYNVRNDCSKNQVKSGSSSFTVGVLLGNGRHIKSYGYSTPKVRLQIMVVYDDGSQETFVSDSGWKVSYGPLQENGLYFGERYDARAEIPGWDDIGFDDSSWENAEATNGPNVASQLIPPIRVVRTLKPVRHWSLENGARIYDFGQNFSGWVKLSMQGLRDSEVRLRHAELLNEDGTLNTSPNQNAEATDVYIMKGEGVETYEPRFTYHGFRYAEISGSPKLPTLIAVEGCFVHTDVEQTGDFSCSHSLINQIHRNILWGQLSNLMSIPTDCTQRDERQGWLGDAHLVAEEAMLNYDMAAFYTKFLRDIQLAQKEDGSLPDTVPPYQGRLYPADPAWSSAYITIVWSVYRYYGDTRILEQHFESMRKYVSFLQTNAQQGIILKLGKYGDWCPPGSIAPKRTPVELTSTWYYYHDTLLLAKIAGVLGKGNEERALELLAGTIRVAFNERFLKEGEYLSNKFAPVDKSPSQTSNLLPLYLDMVPAGSKQQVLGRLLHGIIAEQDYHLDTGILGTRYLLDVLTDYGHEDVAFKIATQKTYPGWGYMVGEGATTLWERWEKITGGGMNSHNHIMLGSVDAWFYHTLAGISCEEAGWKSMRIKPPVLAGLEGAQASIKTVLGDASVYWRKTSESLVLRFQIPVGSRATVHIPMLWDQQTITESDKTLWQSGKSAVTKETGIRKVGIEGKVVVFEFGSGEYHISVENDSSPKKEAGH
jgi:alpha-L-rhamnosidase